MKASTTSKNRYENKDQNTNASTISSKRFKNKIDPHNVSVSALYIYPLSIDVIKVLFHVILLLGTKK